MTTTEIDIILQGVLAKRPMGKSLIFKNTSLQNRLFVLTKDDLSYFDGNCEKMGKKKGDIQMCKVKGVEKVSDSTFARSYCFQIILSDYNLYVFANDEKQREKWIYNLRKVLTDRGTDNNNSDMVASLLRKYHPGAYIESMWSCCEERIKTQNGCKSTFISTISDPTPKVVPEITVPSKTIENLDADEDFKVTAKFNFIPVQETDLQLQKDQQYTILNVIDPNWWLAKDNLGREGFIPSNYVARHFGIESEKWYHSNIYRQDADAKLNDGGQKDGTFMVHDSNRPGMYTLSFCFQGEVKHYHIKLDQDGKYYVSLRHRFDTIAGLIEYHKLNSAGLVTRLRFVYTSEIEPPTASLGHGVFQIPFDELQIRAKIGQGQFGTVHEASWNERNKVAVKMIKDGAMEQDDFIEEAKLMHRFKHKNLVAMHGISYTHEGSICIVVELMSSGSLLDYLRRHKNARIEKQHMEMAFQVCAAMKYLESEKFIHRDLAARNCLVGLNNIVKVSDFGLSRYVLDDEYTASEGTKFPIRWAAPEVIDYTKFSSKSDVWAFGILCWEIVTGGVLPYHGKTNTEIVEDVRNGKRLSKPQTCSRIFFALMQECWDQNPENRPNFKELFGRLDALTEDYCLDELT